MAVEKQVFTNVIKENFIPDTSFLSRCVDMSEFVEHNTINLSEAGADPKVLMNETNDIGMAQRTDNGIAIPLNTFDTESTVVKNIEEVETSYEKTQSVVRSHKSALLKMIAAHAAHNFAPAKDSEFTPVLVATGAKNRYGVAALTFSDLLDLETKFRELDAPMESLVLLLNPRHLADLKAENMKAYKEMMSDKKIGAFDLYTSSVTPTYNGTTGERNAFGAASADTDAVASVAWVETEVMRSAGTIKMFLRENDPVTRGDVFGFQQRYVAMPMRSKYIAAIYSPVIAE